MELELRNVGIIKSAHLEFIQGLNLIVGSSSSGKSTLLRAIRCMMDNSFSDSNISYGQKKMAIRMIYNDHSATYIRDLDNPQRKSAYQIDGKVYTKLGRTSLDEISNLFKLAPIEIDGEKINFNFSTQFSGPFLLLGSQSLLYSILTYRSTFDITKINDLYFTDIKKVKQDIGVLVKTKESLDKEKGNKEKELQPLEQFPSIFIRVQKLKQQYETFQRQKTIYTSYKNTLSQINVGREKVIKLSNILHTYIGFDDKLRIYSILRKYNSQEVERNITNNKISTLSLVLEKVGCFIPSLNIVNVLIRYCDVKTKYDKNQLLLSKINIPEFKIIPILHSYIQSKNMMKEKTSSIHVLENTLEEVLLSIKEVGVCPLCKQPICNH